MSKLIKLSNENYTKVEELLKEHNISIEGTYNSAIEPYLEEEAKYQLEKYKNDNKELVEGIKFDDDLVNDFKTELEDKTELFINGEALEIITGEYLEMIKNEMQ